MKVSAEVVKGICPTCDEDTMLVGLTNELYRCMNCGADLQQHVNGKISYLPVIATPSDKNSTFRKRMERWLNKVSHSLHLVISPRNVDHGNIKNLKISRKNVKKQKRYKGQG